MTVLLVDLEPELASAMRKRLLRDESEVVTCRSHDRAAKLILETSPEMVIMDARRSTAGALSLVDKVERMRQPVPEIAIVADADDAWVLGAMSRYQCVRWVVTAAESALV